MPHRRRSAHHGVDTLAGRLSRTHETMNPFVTDKPLPRFTPARFPVMIEKGVEEAKQFPRSLSVRT